MASTLQLARFAVSYTAILPESAFQEVFPSSVAVLGENIAQQVIAYVEDSKLGYFPAITYFRDNPGIVDDYLLDALDQVAEVAMNLASQKTYHLLQPVFSQVKIISMQNLVYGMPHVRPKQAKLLPALAAQYTPNCVKLGLQLSLFQKSKPREELASAVKKMVLRWLSDVFDEINVNDSRLLLENHQ